MNQKAILERQVSGRRYNMYGRLASSGLLQALYRRIVDNSDRFSGRRYNMYGRLASSGLLQALYGRSVDNSGRFSGRRYSI